MARVAEKPYLEEASLGRFLRERLDPEIATNAQIPNLGHGFRPDYRSERHRLVVEFDGNQHYQRAAHVLGDQRRDEIVRAAGYRVIRIPYFVQLDDRVIDALFGRHVADGSHFKDFPHGFIADTVVFPADYCELGVERLRRDLERFQVIKAEILASLLAAARARGDWREVYPPSLYEEFGRPAE